MDGINLVLKQAYPTQAALVEAGVAIKSWP